MTPNFGDLARCLKEGGLSLDINGNSCVGDAELLFAVNFWKVAVKLYKQFLDEDQSIGLLCELIVGCAFDLESVGMKCSW